MLQTYIEYTPMLIEKSRVKGAKDKKKRKKRSDAKDYPDWAREQGVISPEEDYRIQQLIDNLPDSEVERILSLAEDRGTDALDSQSLQSGGSFKRFIQRHGAKIGGIALGALATGASMAIAGRKKPTTSTALTVKDKVAPSVSPIEVPDYGMRKEDPAKELERLFNQKVQEAQLLESQPKTLALYKDLENKYTEIESLQHKLKEVKLKSGLLESPNKVTMETTTHIPDKKEEERKVSGKDAIHATNVVRGMNEVMKERAGIAKHINSIYTKYPKEERHLDSISPEDREVVTELKSQKKDLDKIFFDTYDPILNELSKKHSELNKLSEEFHLGMKKQGSWKRRHAWLREVSKVYGIPYSKDVEIDEIEEASVKKEKTQEALSRPALKEVEKQALQRDVEKFDKEESKIKVSEKKKGFTDVKEGKFKELRSKPELESYMISLDKKKDEVLDSDMTDSEKRDALDVIGREEQNARKYHSSFRDLKPSKTEEDVYHLSDEDLDSKLADNKSKQKEILASKTMTPEEQYHTTMKLHTEEAKLKEEMKIRRRMKVKSFYKNEIQKAVYYMNNMAKTNSEVNFAKSYIDKVYSYMFKI